MKRRRGLGLLDTILALTLLLIILSLTFELFMTGARSFASGERQHDLSRQATIALDRVTRNLGSARPDSLTVNPTATAFLSSRDGQNQLVLDNSVPVWQAYEIYFLDAAAGELKERRVPLLTATPRLQPIERYDDGGGARPLNFYLNSSDVVARQVSVFELQRPRPERVDLRLRLELRGEGRQSARHLEVRTAVLLRMK